MAKAFLKRFGTNGQSANALENLIMLVMAVVLIIFAVIGFYSIRAHRHDNHRKAVVATIQTKVQEYYARNNFYPKSLSQIGIELKDYHYAAFREGTEPSPSKLRNCDNKATPCVSYVIFTNAMERLHNPYYVRSY